MTENPIQQYLASCEEVLGRIREQESMIDQVAGWFAESIAAGRLVHLFGAGHSRIMVEEMWPRYGSFPGFHPIVELSMTFHTQVVGANGQRQAMFLENQPGLAARILRNFQLHQADCALIISSGGTNIVPIEMAEGFRKLGIKTVGLVSLAHSQASTSKREDGLKLTDVCDVLLDSGAPIGDAVVKLDGLESPVGPTSTVGGCLIINSLKAAVAQKLLKAGQQPKVLTASNLIGSEAAGELFEAAYDEHSNRVSQLYRRT